MDAEITQLLERGVTGTVFLLLYWNERKKVSEVQTARIADLHSWLERVVQLHIRNDERHHDSHNQ